MGNRSVKIGGSNIGGVISTGDHANIRVHNENVGNLPGEQSDKEKIEALVKQLNELLEKVPAEKREEAEAVAGLGTQLIEQASAEKPNKTLLQISANGMIEAAKGLAGVVPSAITIVKDIAGLVTGTA